MFSEEAISIYDFKNPILGKLRNKFIEITCGPKSPKESIIFEEEDQV